MSNATTQDLSYEVPRFTLHPMQRIQEPESQSILLQDAANEIERRFKAIADDPMYRHFVRIPDRIIGCLDYFGADFDRAAVADRMRAYYLFIGVVDHAIDSGEVGTGAMILERFGSRKPSFDTSDSNAKLMTEILKGQITDDIYPLIRENLSELYREVVSERAASSVESYIEYRKAVGRLTADQSYLMIRPLLGGENQRVRLFMQRVGEVGCLVDSVIDLGPDTRRGLLGFRPTTMDFAKLSFCTLREGLSLWVRHLRLTGLFFAAIVDNIRDRFRMNRSVIERSNIDDRKDEAASVA